MTVFPGSEPARRRERAGRQMPPGWAPKPPTPGERADRHRQLAVQRRREAAQRDRDGHGGAARRLRDQADLHEATAAEYDVVASRREAQSRAAKDTTRR